MPYERHGLPSIVRLSPLASQQTDAELERAGYARADPSLVLACSIAVGLGSAAVHIAGRPTAGWLDGIGRANAVAPALRPAHNSIVRPIARPAAFATLLDDGEPVRFGLPVCERGLVGLLDIVVAPVARGRGHGRTLTQAFMAWGTRAGAQGAHLQVRQGNTPAERLYQSLGFEMACGYHYQVLPYTGERLS